jgi:adenosylcobyric acid synthase
VGLARAPRGAEWLRIAAVRLPRISNSTDVEALACEPGVLVRWVRDPADLADADVVVLPGSKATVSDLGWLRDNGLADGIVAHAAAGGPVLGVCGGFQMLCSTIDDRVESDAGRTEGLGLLDADIAFAPAKTLRQWETPLRGYEIHHGFLARSAEQDWHCSGVAVGLRRGPVFGTHWHGLLDNDELRRKWLTDAAAAAGRRGFVVADDVDVTARRDAQLDLMADLLAAHLDVDAVMELLERGVPRRPTVTSSLSNLET